MNMGGFGVGKGSFASNMGLLCSLCRLPFWQRHIVFAMSQKSWHVLISVFCVFFIILKLYSSTLIECARVEGEDRSNDLSNCHLL